MNTLVIGGTGFIGYRLVRRLAAAGHTVTCMDADPAAHSFNDAKDQVTSVRGDVGSFEEVMSVMATAKAEYVANLAYLIGSHHQPRAAMRVNILGMANCFEAARLLNVKRVVYAGSFAANGLRRTTASARSRKTIRSTRSINTAAPRLRTNGRRSTTLKNTG